MATKHRGTLTAEERDERGRMISRDKAAARKLAHARILLQADGSAAGPAWSDERIADALSVSIRTIERVRRRFVAEDLGSALRPKPSQRIYQHKLDGTPEAKLIALACASPPEGKTRWTLRLLAARMVELAIVDGVSHETVRQALKKRAETTPEADVVHSARGQRPRSSITWKTCWRSLAGPTIPSVRWSACGRDAKAADRRDPPAATGAARTGRTLRLRSMSAMA